MSFVDRWFRTGRESHYRRAIELYNHGSFEAAVAAFTEVLSGAIDLHDPRICLARFYLAESHSELGWTAMGEGDLARARDEFLAALDAGYRYPDLHLRLGRVREELGEFEEAENAYAAALAIHSGIFEARARRARLRLSQGLPAGPDLAALVDDGLGLPTGWEHLQDDVRDSTGAMAGSAELSSSDAGSQSLRPTVIARISEELAARESVATQVREALDAFYSSDAESALEQLGRAVGLRPQYPDLHFRIGVLHARAGRLGPAEQALERALELNPRYEEASRWLDRVRASRAA